MSQFAGEKKIKIKLHHAVVICGVIFLHLRDRNGLQNLAEIPSMKSKVILDTKAGRSMQTRKGKPPSRADQGLRGYPAFLRAMQEENGNWQP